jgi:hypothetical protein
VTLILATLAVFFIWETVMSVAPWTIPHWLQPVLVYGAALAYTWPDWRLALAVAGAVGLLHVLIVDRRVTTSRGPVQQVQRPGRAPRIPTLP